MKISSYFSIVITLAVIFLASCNKSDYEEPEDIIGSWGRPAYTDNVEGKSMIVYERTETLSDDGIEFLKNGLLMERKNGGWCGTPPITYDNFSGNWHVKNENIIINVAYWGGMEHRIWKIRKVSGTNLEIEVVLQEYNNKYE